METKNYFIKCKQVIEYNQLVKLTDDQFKQLMQIQGDDVCLRTDRETFNLIEGLINHADIFDSEQEYLQVEITE